MVKALNKFFEYLFILPGLVIWAFMMTVCYLTINLFYLIKYTLETKDD